MIGFTWSVGAQGYKHYTIENGLPSNLVYKIIQDHRGFIWIATDKGISQFDGKNFRTFTTDDGLPTNDIWDIFVTNDNRIWFFSHSDKQGYIYHDTVYAFPNESGLSLYPLIRHIHLHKNQMLFRSINHKNYELIHRKWVATDSIKTHRVIIHDKIRKLIISYNTPHTTISFSNMNGQISRPFILPYQINNEYGQINDSLYVLQSESKLFFINLNRQKIHTLDRPDLFANDKFTRVYATTHNIQISGNNYWAKLSPDYRLEELVYFNEPKNIIGIFKDLKNNYWLYSFNRGMYFITSTAKQTHYMLRDKIILNLKNTGGQIYANVRHEGIYRYDTIVHDFVMFYPKKTYIFDYWINGPDNYIIASQFQLHINKKEKKGKYSLQINKIKFLDSTFYFVKSDGIGIYTHQFPRFHRFVPLSNIKEFTVMGNHLIAGTKAGLYELDKGLEESTYRKIPGFDFPVISMRQKGNKLFIGTDGEGLFIYDGNGHFTHVENTSNLLIHDIKFYHDQFILATQRGLLFYRLENGKPIFRKTLRKVDGLMSDQVNKVIVDDNRLLVASYNGVAELPLKGETNTPMQDIYFESVRYNGKRLDTDSGLVTYAGKSNLTARFGIIDYSGQEHHKYYYKLIPVQASWTEIPSPIVNFGQLSPSEYELQVKAINPYRQSMVKNYRFRIQPLWWQTRWFKVLFVTIGILSLGSIFYWIKQRELRRQSKKLWIQKKMAEHELHALRSQMNPHFVFNSLNAIQSYINDENFEQSEDFLVKFSRLIRMIFDFSRRKTISLAEEIKLLRSYLCLEKMRFGEEFRFCIEVDEHLNPEETEIPTMLLQPIVENAVNHGLFHKKGKGTVCIKFSKIDEQSLEIKVCDDGIGITKSKEINKHSLKKHMSKSTQILMDRIKLLNISDKWHIEYKLEDFTDDDSKKYNTVVTLKITKL